MKSKLSVLTIILIIFTIYSAYQMGNWYLDKQEKWTACENLAGKGSPLSLTDELSFLEWYSDSQDYPRCLDSYGNQFMMYEIMKFITILSVLATILSWKFDLIKKKD